MSNQINKTLQYLSKFNWPSVLWTALVLTLCLMPSREVPDGPKIPGFDKVVHIGLFGAWAFLFACRYYRHALAILLGGGVLGISIELLQEWSNWGRSFEWWDFVADLTGVLFGLYTAKLLNTTVSSR